MSCVPGPRYRVGILPRSSQSICQGTGCQAELQRGFTVVVVPATQSYSDVYCYNSELCVHCTMCDALVCVFLCAHRHVCPCIVRVSSQVLGRERLRGRGEAERQGRQAGRLLAAGQARQ